MSPASARSRFPRREKEKCCISSDRNSCLYRMLVWNIREEVSNEQASTVNHDRRSCDRNFGLRAIPSEQLELQSPRQPTAEFHFLYDSLVKHAADVFCDDVFGDRANREPFGQFGSELSHPRLARAPRADRRIAAPTPIQRRRLARRRAPSHLIRPASLRIRPRRICLRMAKLRTRTHRLQATIKRNRRQAAALPTRHSSRAASRILPIVRRTPT